MRQQKRRKTWKTERRCTPPKAQRHKGRATPTLEGQRGQELCRNLVVGQQIQGSREERRDKPIKKEEKRAWESMGKVSIKLPASVRITASSTFLLFPPRGSCSPQYTIFPFLLNQVGFHSIMFLNIAS